MPSPTETPPSSDAPRLAASMMPGPPPVIVATPALASREPMRTPCWYSGSSRDVRADPNTATAGPRPASASNPSTNSDWMRMARHGSWLRQLACSGANMRSPEVFSGTIQSR